MSVHLKAMSKLVKSENTSHRLLEKLCRHNEIYLGITSFFFNIFHFYVDYIRFT